MNCFFADRFLAEDYAVQVSLNDYLDIYCPHYDRPLATGAPEAFSLLMVDTEGYQGCHETPGAFKRWECSRPYAPFGPVRFSEKIQRFTPFSLGLEFQPGRDYYYICELSVPLTKSVLNLPFIGLLTVCVVCLVCCTLPFRSS